MTKKAIKLQADIGGTREFDCTGGEPIGKHWTVFEIDPATDEDVEDARLLHDLLLRLQDRFRPAKGLEGLLGKDARVTVRLMDGDGRV